MLHAILPDQAGQRIDGLLLFAFAERGIDDSRIEHAARRIHDGDLAAVRVAGIPPHRHMSLHRLHQKRPEVQREIMDRTLRSGIRQRAAQLPFQTRRQQAVIAVGRDCAEKRHGRRSGRYDRAADRLHGKLLVHVHGNSEPALALTAIERQHLMALEPGDRLREVVIEPVDRVLLLCRL